MTEEELVDSILADELGSISEEEMAQAVEEVEPIEEVVEEAPLEEVPQEVVEAPQEPIEEEAIEEQPQVQNELLQQLMAQQQALVEQNQLMKQQMEMQQQPQEPIQELSEEEMAMQELKQRMGLDTIEQENTALKEQLAQVQEFMNTQKQQAEQQAQIQAHQEQIAQEVDRFTRDFPDAKQEAIVDFIDKQPKELRASIDNYNGWAMINSMLEAQAQAVSKPDNIISSKPSAPTPTKINSNMTTQERDMAVTEDILRSLGM